MKLPVLILPVLILPLLAACQTMGAAHCSGRAVGLNPGRWQPTADDLRACSRAVPDRR
jgi:hypothetical protein